MSIEDIGTHYVYKKMSFDALGSNLHLFTLSQGLKCLDMITDHCYAPSIGGRYFSFSLILLEVTEGEESMYCWKKELVRV